MLELFQILHFESLPGTHAHLDEDSLCLYLPVSTLDVRILFLDSHVKPLAARIPDTHDIKVMRLSKDRKLIAVLKEPMLASVQFIALQSSLVTSLPLVMPYSCSLKNSKTPTEIIGFHWLTDELVVIIANIGVEFLHINRTKMTFKTVKSYLFHVNWYKFTQRNSFVCSAGTQGTAFYFFQLKQGGIQRWPAFTLSASQTTQRRLKVLSKHAHLIYLYDTLYFIFADSAEAETRFEIYALQEEKFIKSLELILPAVGEFSVSAIENVLVFHSSEIQQSFMYDVRASEPSEPFARPYSLKDIKVRQDGGEFHEETIEFYGEQFKTFGEIAYSAGRGVVARIALDIEAIVRTYSDESRIELACFLLRRPGATVQFQDTLKAMIEQRAPLRDISRVFEHFLKLSAPKMQQSVSEASATSSKGGSSESVGKLPGESRFGYGLSSFASATSFLSTFSITSVSALEKLPESFESEHVWSLPTQSELYSFVLHPVVEAETLPNSYLIGVLVELLKWMEFNNVRSETFIDELLFHLLVQDQQYALLHQMIQHHLINDSVRMAQTLLHIEGSYQPLFQVAVDMLKRLEKHELIVQALLSKNLVLPAITYVRDRGLLRSIKPKDFFVAASRTKDTMLFYNVYKFLEQRNMFLYNQTSFSHADDCAEFIREYNKLVLPRAS